MSHQSGIYTRIALVAVAVAVVSGAILASSFLGVETTITRTSTFTTISTFTTTFSPSTTVTSTVNYTDTVLEYGMVYGNCTRTYYYLSDRYTEISSNVTITSGNTTSYSASTTVIVPSVVTDGSTTYTSTEYTTATAVFTVISTSTDLNAAPSSAWYVTVCVFTP